MPRYILDANGSLTTEDGTSVVFDALEDEHIHVPHLAPHVVQFNMPRGDVIGIKVIYSSHCWSEGYDPLIHNPVPMMIMDGATARVFSSSRFADSYALCVLLDDLANRRIYWTPSDRNFGIYNATVIVNGLAYTAFFTLGKERGKLNAMRHSVIMRVESAYHAPQSSKGMKISAAAAIDAALKEKKLAYRR